ncbi:MAG: hypothetical protein EB824_02445 [Thaumarchaeota archaeon S15]|nr:MAG: hypothetical protein EB833_02765 [Thaumarchaeota archaeon S13]RNJ74937.1 MAG: hypothetical protein EB824_02445 [Thaumarchaeota archaeon S15]
MEGTTVAVQVSGEHPLRGRDAGDACAEIAHRFSRDAAPYIVRSSVPGHAVSRGTGHGLRPSIEVDISESSFEACWESRHFAAPGSLLPACAALRPAGEVTLRFSASIDDIYMAPPRIGTGRPAARFPVISFEPESLDPGGLVVRGVAMQTGPHTARITVFGEAASEMAGMPRLLERALGALEAHCREYAS